MCLSFEVDALQRIVAVSRSCQGKINMPLIVINGPVIEAGQALSDLIDLTADIPVRVTMPADWSPDAILTFLISSDGQGFNPLVYADGTYMDVNVVPGAALIVPDEVAQSVGFLKLHSGTPDNPVPQSERREFAVAVRQGARTP
jgi:hypothetical protein